MKNCQDFMTENPACCLPSDTVASVAERMQNENIGSLPVVDNTEEKQLIGMITDRDLALRVVSLNRNAATTTIAEVMTPNPIVCHPTDSADAAMALMSSHQIRRIPVVNDQGQVVGIIAQADVAMHVENNEQVSEMLSRISQPEAVIAR